MTILYPTNELSSIVHGRYLEIQSEEAMGRRKSKRKPPPKKKMTQPLETQFTCPFCNHERSCEVEM